MGPSECACGCAKPRHQHGRGRFAQKEATPPEQQRRDQLEHTVRQALRLQQVLTAGGIIRRQPCKPASRMLVPLPGLQHGPPQEDLKTR